MISDKHIDVEITHAKSHGRFAIIDLLPDEYCRAVPIELAKEGKEKIGNTFYTLWTKLVSPVLNPADSQPCSLSGDVSKAVTGIRQKLSEGTHEISHNHLVKKTT